MFTSSRREFMGLGAVALPAMLAAQAPHHKAKAKNCIFLLMEGGPSQTTPAVRNEFAYVY